MLRYWLIVVIAALLCTPIRADTTTVVTHGFQLDWWGNSIPDVWTTVMARAVAARAGDGRVYRYQPGTGNWNLVDWVGPGGYTNIVLIFDWSYESDQAAWKYADAAGDALYTSLRGGKLCTASGSPETTQVDFTARTMHFIGHSRGTVVNSEAVRRLGTTGIPVDQVTMLDPHPVDGLIGIGDWGDRRPRVWQNVTWADDYFRHNIEPWDFDGREIDHAAWAEFPDSLFHAQIQPCSGDPGYNLSDHSDVHLWYHGTIDRLAVFDGNEAITACMNTHWWETIGRSDQGYSFSRLGGGAPRRPYFNATPNMGIQARNADDPRDPILPDVPRVLFSGDFAKGSAAGWAYHGGGGAGLIQTDGVANGRSWLRLDANHKERYHNRIWLEDSTDALYFDYRVAQVNNPNADDRLTFYLIEANTSNWYGVYGVSVGKQVTGWLSSARLALNTLIPRNRVYQVLVVSVPTVGSIGTVVDVSNIVLGRATPPSLSWQAVGLGVNGQVSVMSSYGGGLVAGGCFASAGTLGVNYVARWNGAEWEQLGNGMNHYVSALARYNTELVAGGMFSTAGGVPANHIARWNGTFWQPVGTGMDGYVNALVPYGGELVAGGPFTTAGGVSANRIARWNGVSWRSLGAGTNDAVSALTVYNGELVAGGYFTAAGGVSASHIARWDGTSWRPLGAGLNGTVNALAVYNGELIAGGSFTMAGSVGTKFLARWDGVSWRALGPEVSANVRALAVYSGGLAVGGDFTTGGGVIVNFIGSWNGTSWQGFGTGMNDSAFAISEYDGVLIAGGAFTAADGFTASRIAGWSATPALRITQHPSPTTVAVGQTAVLRASAVGGHSAKWRRNGMPIADGLHGASSSGGTVSGAMTSELVITNVQTSDMGDYVFSVLAYGLGDVSNPALLTVPGGLLGGDGGCHADYNSDGFVDPLDYNAFINDFEAGDLKADYNGDGFLDPLDYNEFINDFETGC